jgi:heptosyltransferase-2
MNTLIIKLGATGDVVRTTPLLRVLPGHISWITEAKNTILLAGIADTLRCVAWEHRESVKDRAYDLVINLEDTLEAGIFLQTLDFRRVFGAFVEANGSLCYTNDSRGWFDLSLISTHGKTVADHLKLLNRCTYQELIFTGLGLTFAGESYLLPESAPTSLAGDVAIAAEAGPVWPMKKWAYYNELKHGLQSSGLTVNFLPKRATMIEHLADVRNHRLLVSGDSLPMHLALGSGVRCVTLFTCTSPWEIHGYGLQTKIISPVIDEYFYRRDFDVRATTVIEVDSVHDAILHELNLAALHA